MNYILSDGKERESLLPLTYTRPVAEIRCGILTITEKWEHFIGKKPSFHTQAYLSKKYPTNITNDNLIINGAIFPNKQLYKIISGLQSGQILKKAETVIAWRTSDKDIENNTNFEVVETDVDFQKIENTWDIFHLNHKAIEDDFLLITENRTSEKLSETNFIIGDKSKIFVEPGAVVEYAFLNTTEGSIYIGRDSEIMEGSKIRGSMALCEHSTIKLDAKIYSGTTIGPHSKVGGEVTNTVILGYSNKGHDGFLGNSVIGEWCNLGADTNNSNLKNTYDIVRLWSISENTFVNTGLQFCGLIMGDHSKSGINTMFNTGTVIGVSSNIYGDGFQRNYIPSFMWGGHHGLKAYNFKKSVQVATAVMLRRNIEFDTVEEDIFKYLFDEQHGQ